jgi:hypothetical protein
MIGWVDAPADLRIESAAGVIRGWCAVPLPSDLTGLRFEFGGIPAFHDVTERIDVEGAYPAHDVKGFVIRFDLRCYISVIQDWEIVLSSLASGQEPLEFRLKVGEQALYRCLTETSGR